MQPLTQPPSPIVPLPIAKATIQVVIKRDDLLQPTGDHRYCGNKVRKLQYNLAAAKAQGYQQLLTFGGAYSNHIAAVARAGKRYGFKTIGIIRGEAHSPLNPTLADAVKDGMQLAYLDRTSYRKKQDVEIIARFKQQFGDFYLIPEGGTNTLALKGCAEIVTELATQLDYFPDFICAACGTGGTLAGIIQACAGRGQVLGVSALKGDFMGQEIRKLLGKDFPYQNWSVRTDYHFGGYAKFPWELRRFVEDFQKEYGILLDPIYTSKLFYGLLDLIQQDFFPIGSNIVVVHSGGLQGWKGIDATVI